MENLLDAVLIPKSDTEVYDRVAECLRVFVLTIQLTLYNVGSLFLFYPFCEAFFTLAGKSPNLAQKDNGAERGFDEIVDENGRYEAGLFFGVLDGLWSTLKREEEEGTGHEIL